MQDMKDMQDMFWSVGASDFLLSLYTDWSSAWDVLHLLHVLRASRVPRGHRLRQEGLPGPRRRVGLVLELGP